MSIATRLPIYAIQGDGPKSPYEGKTVKTTGVVTGHQRGGFFIQDPKGDHDPKTSDAVFVRSFKHKPPVGSHVEVTGSVEEFVSRRRPHDRPNTRINCSDVYVLAPQWRMPQPARMNSMPRGQCEAADFLESHEGMLVEIPTGAVLAGPSNPFGDYVTFIPEKDDVVTRYGGIRKNEDKPHRALLSFRLDRKLGDRPRVNVGAVLGSSVVGPLNYRSGDFQVQANAIPSVFDNEAEISRTTLVGTATQMTVLTLNCFNLDPKKENRALVNSKRDIDDDVGDGRFDALAAQVVANARCPDVVALQEIQDNDGAEDTSEVDASLTYQTLIDAIIAQGGPRYRWVDVPPVDGADGGQPGGNIRNGYLYNPDRVELVKGSVGRIGEGLACFDHSRKPLTAEFRFKNTGETRTLINVHLASKRHQRPWNSLDKPGFDPVEPMRVEQAEAIRKRIDAIDAAGGRYYVTGDFNDTEYSKTIKTLADNGAADLISLVPEVDRFDYTHRGHAQVLNHGIVDAHEVKAAHAEYEIIHGNEIIGTVPGEFGTRPSDHGLSIARLNMTAD